MVSPAGLVGLAGRLVGALSPARGAASGRQAGLHNVIGTWLHPRAPVPAARATGPQDEDGDALMPESKPLVTIIVPVCDSATTLPLCLAAIAAQSYAPIEIIVVDDGSTDDSASIAQAAGATVVGGPVNQGVGGARNLGAAHANGDILFFLDSDIALAPDAVAVAVATLQQHPEAGAVTGALDAEPLLPVGLAGRYRAVQQYVWFNEVDGEAPGLRAGICAIPARVFAQIGPFDPRLRHTEDQEYNYRLARHYCILATPALCGRHDYRTTLRAILGKVFQRARHGSPLWLRNRGLPGGAATGHRALGSACLLAALVALPSPLLLGPWALLATPVLLAVAIGLDHTTYRYAFTSGGVAFGGYFTLVHLLVTSVSAVAVGVGVLQHLLTRSPSQERVASASPEPGVRVPSPTGRSR
jgi:GT2 family glycosyltransferase